MFELKTNDLGRRVKLSQFNGPTLEGELVGFYALVKFDGDRVPIRTEVPFLEWVVAAPTAPPANEKASEGPEGLEPLLDL